jgi:phosphate transport system ATP-binding protein
MQQAARASDYTAFMTMGDDRAGYVVEQGETGKIFTAPQQAAHRRLRLGPLRLIW